MKKQTIVELGQKTIFDENSNELVLSTLWSDNKVILMFVRHFG